MDYLDALEVVKGDLYADARTQWAKLAFLRKQLNGLVSKTWTPPDMDDEYSDFLRKSRSPLLDFAAICISQGLVVDGHSDQDVWARAWHGTGMAGKQPTVNYETVAYGYSFLAALPAEADGMAISRPLSPLTTFGSKKSPWDDDFEIVVHKAREDRKRPHRNVTYVFTAEETFKVYGKLTHHPDVERVPHGLGRNPVTMIESRFSADEYPESVVEPGIPAYKRVVDATFSMKMIERYGAFPQKFQAGGEIATDENGNALIRPAADSLIHSDDYDTKFGSFQAADVDKAANAVDHHKQDLAAVLQLPPHYLLGKVVNLSSDAIAATETGFNRKIGRLQESMQEGYERHLRKVCDLIGMRDAAADMTSEVHWLDTAVRSLAQVADAIQKLDAVGADRELLFHMVPGWSKQDAQVATRIALARESASEQSGGATARPR